jgi:hypothetical protein
VKYQFLDVIYEWPAKAEPNVDIKVLSTEETMSDHLSDQLCHIGIDDTADDHMDSTDTIGDTVYSKHWLFKCLVNAVKVLQALVIGHR